MKLEAWVDWIQRATGVAVDALKKAKIEDWCEQRKRNYWRWAGHICRRNDSRWSVKVLHWLPSGGGRKAGHPKKRWRDEIEEFFRCADLRLRSNQRKQLQYIWRHAGESVEADGCKRSQSKWRSIWKKYEEAFVKF